MFKERLIESFTWLFMEVEVLLLEEVEVPDKFNDFVVSTFYPVFCYMSDLDYSQNITGKGDFDYLEILDFLINESQSTKVDINIGVMKYYNEMDILKLIKNTVKLIQFLKCIS